MAEGRDAEKSTSGGFSNLVALLALAISLASAGWSVFAFWKSSEIRPLPFEEVNFLNEKGVGQIQIEVTVANLAYGDYHDVARVEEVILEKGGQRLRFDARSAASVRQVQPDENNTYPTLEHRCRWGGEGLEVCGISDSPVVALPAGGVVTHYPLFELAYEDCGRDDCEFISTQDLSAFLQGDVRLTYVVKTLRDGDHPYSCMLRITADEVRYYQDAGWFNPGCKAE